MPQKGRFQSLTVIFFQEFRIFTGEFVTDADRRIGGDGKVDVGEEIRLIDNAGTGGKVDMFIVPEEGEPLADFRFLVEIGGKKRAGLRMYFGVMSECGQCIGVMIQREGGECLSGSTAEFRPGQKDVVMIFHQEDFFAPDQALFHRNTHNQLQRQTLILIIW